MPNLPLDWRPPKLPRWKFERWYSWPFILFRVEWFTNTVKASPGALYVYGWTWCLRVTIFYRRYDLYRYRMVM
jgi:hypothetical protein